MLSKGNKEIIRRILEMSDESRISYYKRLSPGSLALLENLFEQYQALLDENGK